MSPLQAHAPCSGGIYAAMSEPIPNGLPLLFSTRVRESCIPGIVGKSMPISGRPIGTGHRKKRDGSLFMRAPPLRPNYEAGLNCILNFDGRVDFVSRRW